MGGPESNRCGGLLQARRRTPRRPGQLPFLVGRGTEGEQPERGRSSNRSRAFAVQSALNCRVSWQRDDRDVAMRPRERAKVVGIAGEDRRTAKPDRRRDDRCIDGVTGVEPVSSKKAARDASNPVIDRDDAIGAAHDAVDRCIATRASIDLGEDRRRDSHQRGPTRSFHKRGLGAPRRRAALASMSERAHRLAVEHEEPRHSDAQTLRRCACGTASCSLARLGRTRPRLRP